MERSSSFALALVVSSSAMLAAGSGGCGGNIGYFPDGGTSDDGGRISVIKDGGTDGTDATKSVPPIEDAGPSKRDARPPRIDDDASACSPGDVSTFVPHWNPPMRSAVCTAQKVTDLMTCVFDPNADATTCDPMTKDPANKACMDCLLTPSTSTHGLGPVVIDGNIGTLNIPGCIALVTGDAVVSGCGAKLQASEGCKSAACAANCPLSDDASLHELEACETQAAANDCSAYAAPADACSKPLLAADGGAAQCAFGTSFLDQAIAFGKMFCGP